MSDSFPWPLLILFELIHISICYPTPRNYFRQWLLAPSMVPIAIYLWTQTSLIDPATAYTVGANLSFQLCSMTYLVYIQPGFPDFWRRVKDGDQPPSTFPLRQKLRWMLDLAYSVRRVGWVQEPRNALPPRPKFDSRIMFIATRLAYMVVHFLILDLAFAYQAGNPDFDSRLHPSTDGPEAYLQAQSLPWQMLGLLSWGSTLVCGVRLFQAFFSVVSVGFGQSDPEDWPYMFGDFSEAYTLRQFWGKTWHQRMRPMMSGIGKHIAHKTLNFTPGTVLSSCTQLYITFFLSALLHVGGDFMVVRYIPTFPFKFFMLQAVAITIEDLVIWCTKSIRPQLGRLTKPIGFFWVIAWFTYYGPIWLDPMSVNGNTINGEGEIFRGFIDFLRAAS